MNKFIARQLEHRTIREFQATPVPLETRTLLEDVAMQTATSNGMQQASIIRVTNPELKEQIAEVCKQEYVARAPELWIFLVDLYRNTEIAKSEGVDTRYAGELERFLQGYSDAVLMAQNVNNAIEMLNLGAVYLGSIQNNMGRMIEILNLPHFTAPVLGLGFGFPAQQPQLKPRMPKSLRIFENHYQVPEDAETLLNEYDQEMTTYYDLRDQNQRSDSYKQQVKQKFSTHDPRREALVEDLANQGFFVQRPKNV